MYPCAHAYTHTQHPKGREKTHNSDLQHKFLLFTACSRDKDLIILVPAITALTHTPHPLPLFYFACVWSCPACLETCESIVDQNPSTGLKRSLQISSSNTPGCGQQGSETKEGKSVILGHGEAVSESRVLLEHTALLSFLSWSLHLCSQYLSPYSLDVT